jgi:hypothetical protein
LKLLSHFEGGPQIDFPHFLWVSLNKMVRGVKSTSKKPETSIHHHGLTKLLVVCALRKQGSSWKQLLQQKISREGMFKFVEEQETEVHSEGSSRKTRKNKGKKLGGEEAIVTPISSQPIDELDKDNFVVEDPTASKKKKTSQSQKISPTLIPKTKTQKRKVMQEHRSTSARAS